jgi:hypothetical protein
MAIPGEPIWPKPANKEGTVPELVIEVDAWRDKAETQSAVREQLNSMIQDVAEANSLNLSRLLGVTVTDRIDEALAGFDDGGIENGRTLTRTNGAVVGVGMTPICKRDGHAFCQLFLRADDVFVLLERNDRQAGYILAHELGHAHDLAQKAKTVESIILELPGDQSVPPVIWQIADIVWNEYAACRKSGTEHPGMLNTMYSMLDRALSGFATDVRLMVGIAKTAKTMQSVMDSATETLEPILKYSSYVLGHRASLGQGPLPLPEELETLLQENGFRQLYEELSAILETMWESHGSWKDQSDYELLLNLVRRAYAVCGLNIYQENGTAKVIGIPDVLRRITEAPGKFSL